MDPEKIIHTHEKKPFQLRVCQTKRRMRHVQMINHPVHRDFFLHFFRSFFSSQTTAAMAVAAVAPTPTFAARYGRQR